MKNYIFILSLLSFAVAPNIYSMQLFRWFSGDESSMQSSSRELSNSGVSTQSSPNLPGSESSIQTYGLTPDEIAKRDSTASAIQKSHSVLSNEEATTIATSFFVCRERIIFWGDLERQLQTIQARLPQENCIQAMCASSKHMIFMAVMEHGLSQSEIAKRDVVAKSLMTSHPDLIQEDAIIIATSFFIGDKGSLAHTHGLAEELEKIQAKFQEESCVYALCKSELDSINKAIVYEGRRIFKKV